MGKEMSVSDYITLMAKASMTTNCEIILECLDSYNLLGTRELTTKMAREFCEKKGLIT